MKSFYTDYEFFILKLLFIAIETTIAIVPAMNVIIRSQIQEKGFVNTVIAHPTATHF